MMKPLILISNDDGINSRGIHFLVDCVRPMADVVVVAPAAAQSGKSSALTVDGALRLVRQADYNGAQMWTVSGTPVDCVKLALHHALPRRPDLMLSGVNHGSNAGISEIYSGTMGAVYEATVQGISAIGYSLLSHSPSADFSPTEVYVKEITRKVLSKGGLPAGVCLNVNFPKVPKILGVKLTRQAWSHWTEEYARYDDPHGRPFFWLTGKMVNDEPEATDTDLYWLSKDYASVVPLTYDRNVDLRHIRDFDL